MYENQEDLIKDIETVEEYAVKFVHSENRNGERQWHNAAIEYNADTAVDAVLDGIMEQMAKGTLGPFDMMEQITVRMSRIVRAFCYAGYEMGQKAVVLPPCDCPETHVPNHPENN